MCEMLRSPFNLKDVEIICKFFCVFLGPKHKLCLVMTG